MKLVYADQLDWYLRTYEEGLLMEQQYEDHTDEIEMIRSIRKLVKEFSFELKEELGNEPRIDTF